MNRQTKKIIIVGAGFAGLTAARKLAKSKLGLEITLFDKKENSEFLPMLPDCIGRAIEPAVLSYRIADFCAKLKISFIRQEVKSIDLQAKRLIAEKADYNYDFLLIASGSQTNFFSNKNAAENAIGLNSIRDVEQLISVLKNNESDNFIVSGGGYTGIEAATHLGVYFKKRKLDKKIIIVEKSPRILGSLPDWMKEYTEKNLKSLGIEIFADSVIEDIQKNKVKISQGRFFDKAAVVWVAGVRTADFIQQLQVQKNPQGRIITDQYLRINPDAFCVGDAAFFGDKENSLRMAVQFSITEGSQASGNIIRSVKGAPLKKFKPVDLGFIVPMANNRSCGIVFGVRIKGFIATVFHFIMCIYRSYGFKNKFGIIGNLIKSAFNRQGGVRC